MKHIPISIQTFEKVREDQLVYVDKTEYVFKLYSQGKYFFLSRPRRFGKSMLLTTIHSFFKGDRHLFEGLFIYDKITEKEWPKHPVIHIDYSLVDYKNGKDIFRQSLLNHLKNIAQIYAVKLTNTIVADALVELVSQLESRFGKVVILVDEYDKPMVDMLAKAAEYEENKEILRGLYGVMKGLDHQLRFVMLTGVSRFSKVNVFSGMNNLQDISMTAAYSQITGFSQEELHQYFTPHLKAVHEKFPFSWEEFLFHVKKKYNGFSWDGTNRLYNPFSLFKFFIDKEFGNYWFSTGTPNFLIDLVMSQKELPENLESIVVADLIGHSSNLKTLPVHALLFQTGYLTIKQIERDGTFQFFYLGYPNDEVRHAFTTYILAAFVGKDEFNVQPEAIWLRKALHAENIDRFTQLIQSFLADIPARLHLPKEAYYHSLIYMLLRLVGMDVLLEKETDKGRIDAVLELPGKTYVIEFKFGQGKKIKRVETLAKQALKQIEDNKYYEPFLSKNGKILLLGMGFLDKKVTSKVKVLAVGREDS
jgi:hypothetical protein